MERVFKRATKLISGLVMLTALAVGLLSESTSAVALEYEFYTPPSTTSGIPSMALGPDGNMWFVKSNQDQIGKVTPNGVITEYDLNPNDRPLVIAAGPDGNMWFTTFSKKIGKSTTSGSITYYDVSGDLGSEYAPWGIAAGPDGNVWVNAPLIPGASGTGKLIKMSTPGVTTVYNIRNGSRGIVAGSDGNVWFGIGGATGTTNYVGRITPAGVITEFELPGLGAASAGMALGSDGNVWFVRLEDTSGSGKIGKITPDGIVTEYITGTSVYSLTDLALGPNGNIWFTEGANSLIGEMDTSGNVSIYELPVDTLPYSIATGSDEKIWFGNQLTIGKITNTPPPPPPPPPPNPEDPPKPPKSGKILGAAIATVSLLSIVMLATLEVKKSSLEAKKSSK